MSDLYPEDEGLVPSEPTPAEEPAAPDFESAFSDMEDTLSGVPDGATITLRHSSGSPVYVPLFEGETGLTLRDAINRAGLTIGVVNAYIDQNSAPIAFETFIAAGTVVTLVGNVKGGTL